MKMKHNVYGIALSFFGAGCTGLASLLMFLDGQNGYGSFLLLLCAINVMLGAKDIVKVIRMGAKQ